MSIIGAGIAVFLGAAGACVIVCAIHGAAAVGPAPVTQNSQPEATMALGDGGPAAE